MSPHRHLPMPMYRALYNRTVVAARSQLLGFRSGEDMLAAEIKLVVVCGRDDWSLCCAQRDEIYLMTDSPPWRVCVWFRV